MVFWLYNTHLKVAKLLKVVLGKIGGYQTPDIENSFRHIS